MFDIRNEDVVQTRIFCTFCIYDHNSRNIEYSRNSAITFFADWETALEAQYTCADHLDKKVVECAGFDCNYFDLPTRLVVDQDDDRPHFCNDCV